ncbi:MAG: hypothetical protein WDW38_001498 [Sanguina aurantia]
MTPVYLIDVSCYRPPEEYKAPFHSVMALRGASWVQAGEKDRPAEENEFQKRVFDRAGLDPEGTFLPPAINPRFCGHTPDQSMTASNEECRLGLFGAMEGLLAKTGLVASDIDIIMREDTQSYHLGGMGCSNGVIAVNLVADLLRSPRHRNSNAVLLTIESTTPAYYIGHDRTRLVANCLFRMGSAAVLFSNKENWRSDNRAKYRLLFHQRVHIGSSDEAFRAIEYSPDPEGHNGIFLGKNVVTEASKALTKAMWKIGPRLLTWGQIAAYASNYVQRKVLRHKNVAPYQPMFYIPVQHFLIHAGGSKVLDGLGKALSLSDHLLQPSRDVLFDYGNISSSTTWYTMADVETTRGVKQGDKLLQIGMGSGIKCGVNVWQALRDVHDLHPAWAHKLTADQIAVLRKTKVPPPSPPYLAMLLLLLLALLAAAFTHLPQLRQWQRHFKSEL